MVSSTREALGIRWVNGRVKHPQADRQGATDTPQGGDENGLHLQLRQGSVKFELARPP